ncbi:MAG: hypothetical protein Q8K62_00320 [Thiobacillus sp.]|nr:hypothetical protein [Thiobacillus sp.]
MQYKKIWVVTLFLTGVLPATAIALLSALVGLPFFVLGIIEFIKGNIDFLSVLSGEKPGIVLLWITGPLGLIGLYTLWKLTYFSYRNIPIKNRGSAISGLVAGLIAGIQMLSIQFGLLILLLPSAVCFSLQLYKERNLEH